MSPVWPTVLPRILELNGGTTTWATPHVAVEIPTHVPLSDIFDPDFTHVDGSVDTMVGHEGLQKFGQLFGVTKNVLVFNLGFLVEWKGIQVTGQHYVQLPCVCMGVHAFAMVLIRNDSFRDGRHI